MIEFEAIVKRFTKKMTGLDYELEIVIQAENRKEIITALNEMTSPEPLTVKMIISPLTSTSTSTSNTSVGINTSSSSSSY